MKEKLASVQARMNAITGEIDKLLSGDGAMTAENQTKHDALTAEFEGLERTAKALKGNIAREDNLREIDPNSRPSVNGLNDREVKDVAGFSFLKAILAQIDPTEKLEGIEREMIQEGNKERAANGISGGQGFHVPSLVFAALAASRFRNDLTAGGAGAGAEVLTREPLQGIVDPFYEAMAVRQLGATYLTGLNGNIPFPKMGRSVARPTYKAENGAADELDPTTSVITLAPKRLPAFIEVSKLLLLQTSPSVEAWIRSYLLTEIGMVWERAILHGSGSGGQPTGLASWAGIGSVAGGTNGLAPNNDHIIDLETAVANVNALQGSTGYLTNTRVRGRLKKTSIEAATNAEKIWDRRSPDSPLNGYRAGVSNLVSNTLTKGTSTGVCSAIFFGNWSDLVIGQWGGLDLQANPFSRDTEGIIRLTAAAYGDHALLRAESMAAMLDALTA